MKIAFFETEPWEADYFKQKLEGFEMDFFVEKLSLESVEKARGAQVISVFINSPITKELLAKMPDVKMIAVRATGFDAIDVEEASHKGILVCNVPTYGENTVAEHTFGLMLNLSRQIHTSIHSVRQSGFKAQQIQGFDLKGKTLGIIGTGHIGQHVARIARGFEMNVLASDVKQDKRLAKKLGFKYVSLQDLLKQSDIITLHVPYNKGTHHLINANNIMLIKRGAYLINTARGGIVETNALVKALDSGILAGAGLDVLEEELSIKEERQLLSGDSAKNPNFKTLLENHILMERENVIITPHNAFNSREAIERIMETTIENIKAFSKNKKINAVA